MRRRLWKRIGTGLFWMTWPLLYVYLRRGARTRILVVSRDEVLVVKSWLGADRWALPGGGLHRGEDPLMGVLRELREETGISVPPEQPRALYEGTYRQNGLKFKYRCYVVGLPNKLPLTPQKIEVASTEWVQRDQLTPANAGQDVLTALDHWFVP